MSVSPLLRRALTRAAQILYAGSTRAREPRAAGSTLSAPTAMPAGSRVVPQADVDPYLSPGATEPVPPAPADRSAGADSAASVVPEARESLPGSLDLPPDSHHGAGLAMAREHRWNWAQRELEQAVRHCPHGPARDDLASVRAVRRQLRVLAKWPRDAAANLALGQAYMELGLGEDAEATFRQAAALAPGDAAAYYYLALEYAYRGTLPEAERAYAKARARAAQLPPFAAALAEWQALLVGPAADAGLEPGLDEPP